MVPYLRNGSIIMIDDHLLIKSAMKRKVVWKEKRRKEKENTRVKVNINTFRNLDKLQKTSKQSIGYYSLLLVLRIY